MSKIKTLRGASDKSISHRAAMLASLANNRVIIKNYLFAEDTVHTLKAMSMLGVDIEERELDIVIRPKGKYSLTEPNDIINMGNSGTGIRLLSGILSGFEFLSVLTGDVSLRNRPMMRIIEPLTKMGSSIYSRNGGCAPLSIYGKKNLNGINYKTKVASAQVKSAVLLAGLFSNDAVCIEEPTKSRDHTENMLRFFGVDIKKEGNKVCLLKNRDLYGNCVIDIPADISSSAFFAVLALLKPDLEILLRDVVLNETRSGILNVFTQCGANFEIVGKRIINNELVGDLLVKYTEKLMPFSIDADLIPSLIDEIPILSVLAIFCDGVSSIKGAAELRKKESDRISAICNNLSLLGVKVEEFEDGFNIFGQKRHQINKSKIETYFDHRIAMSFSILSAAKNVDLKLSETQSIKTSYPGFFDHLNYVIS